MLRLFLLLFLPRFLNFFYPSLARNDAAEMGASAFLRFATVTEGEVLLAHGDLVSTWLEMEERGREIDREGKGVYVLTK